LNKYCGREWVSNITEAWMSRLAHEHVIKIQEEKSIVDLMLGVLAMIGGTRLESYALDMAKRSQTPLRISGVRSALEGVSTELVPVKRMATDLKASGLPARTSNKGTRL